jgi:excisionase family DNA binding protein
LKPADALFDAIVEAATAEAERRVLERLGGKLVEDKTLTVDEVAEKLKVSPKLVYQLCKEGKIPHERFGTFGNVRSGAIRFSSLELEVWRQAQRKTSVKVI